MPDPSRKKTVLLFVIRDKTKTPLPKLVEVGHEEGRKRDPLWHVGTAWAESHHERNAGCHSISNSLPEFLIHADAGAGPGHDVGHPAISNLKCMASDLYCMQVLEQDLDKMWDSISKPHQYTDSKMKDFFDVSSS